MIDYIDRQELLRVIRNGSNFNLKCPAWVEDVIRHQPKATDGKSIDELVNMAADFLNIANERDKESDK